MPNNQRPTARWMDRNHTTRLPRKLVFFDTETSKIVHSGPGKRWSNVFRLCCATYVRLEEGRIAYRSQQRFASAAQFWSWLEYLQSIHSPVWCYAHNLAFDWRILGGWDQMDDGSYTVGPLRLTGREATDPKSRLWTGQMVLERSPFYLYLHGKRGRVNFVDSYNYFGRALKDVGEVAGVPKGEWPGWDASTETLFAHCDNDVAILERAILSAMLSWRQWDCGVWQPTASSLSMHSFQHQHKDSFGGRLLTRILLDDDEAAIALEREAYMGGHFEAFYHGRIVEPEMRTIDLYGEQFVLPPLCPVGPIHHYDVTGLYPSVMRDYSYPVRRIAAMNNPDLAWLYGRRGNGNLLATVTLETMTETYPVRLPNGQCHCLGKFTTVLCGPELDRALNNGHVVECHSAIQYEVLPIFMEWVDL